MASFRLRRERESRARAIAALSAGSIAAGAALFYFLDPRRGEDRRRRTVDAVKTAEKRVEERARGLGSTARDLGARAAETLRETRGKVERGVQQASERARGAADEVRASAGQGQEALARRGIRNDQALQGAAGGVLLARAIFGGGLMRIPAGMLGVSILAKLASRSDSLQKGVSRGRDAARTAADRLREGAEAAQGAMRGDAGQQPGGEQARGGGSAGARRQPEVREVKSPAELEPGIASGRPDPTYRDRVDRSGPHMGGRGGGPGGYDAAAGGPADLGEDGGFLAPGTDDVSRSTGFDAPEAGASVREGDLGVVIPREGGERDQDAGGSPRIVAPGEGHENPSARIVGPDERPVGDLSPDEDPAPRIAGAGADVDASAADRRDAGEADVVRRDPNVDGG
jgi:gas vesicle protein